MSVCSNLCAKNISTSSAKTQTEIHLRNSVVAVKKVDIW